MLTHVHTPPNFRNGEKPHLSKSCGHWMVFWPDNCKKKHPTSYDRLVLGPWIKKRNDAILQELFSQNSARAPITLYILEPYENPHI